MKEKDEVNSLNKYSHNFFGVYCTCSRPYPDPDDQVEDEMIQCVVCEDWLHGRVHYDEAHFLPHTREKRSVLTDKWNYILDVVVNTSSAQTFEQIRFALNATSLPIQLDNNTEITDVVVTTVCSPTGSGFQCRCEEQFAWPYSSCVLYRACDSISSGICKCINAIPANGQSCQPISELLSEVEYTVDVELNVTDVETINYLRNILSNGSYSLALGPIVNVTDIDITTVCYPNDTNFQCRCEDQHVWSYRNCITYGACDEIADNTCRCINGIPSDGQYCQPKEVPSVVYEYEIFIEVNTTDPDQLRNFVDIHTFPVQVSSQINISAADITTVCSKDGNEFQCRCEDDYLWPCDKCATHGKCDGDANNSCACIKAIPTDGQYCQSIHQQNFSVCQNCSFMHLLSAAPPVLYEYLISIELNISDVAVINQLRSILSNISYPISISNQLQISDVNISTVCSPSSGSFQCRCEDQYRWPLLMAGKEYPSQLACYPPTTTTTTRTTTPPTTSFDVQMSVRLDKDYTDALSNSGSDTYKNLKSSIETVVEEQYKGITGFLNVFVNAFREGSVITDFVVQTTQVKTDEFAKANQALPEAMKPIAPVLGSVTALYNSPTPISPPPDILYTGNTMTLTCGPPEGLAIGTISRSGWKFNGREIKNNTRIKMTISGKQSLLTIQNVVLADIGNYECTLEGQVITFSQKGRVLEAKIQPAPIVQLQSKVNVNCQEVKQQPLDCCVQSLYKVKWYQGPTVLEIETISESGIYCIKHKYPISCDGLTPISFECKVDQPTGYKMTTAMNIFRDNIDCRDSQYGVGQQDDTSTIGCGKGQEGSKTAVCQEKKWKLIEDTCILSQIKELLIVSQDLEKEQVPAFVGNLSKTVVGEKTQVSGSSATISAIVGILNTIANVSTTIDKPVMEDVLQTVDVIIGDDARESWATLNANETRNASSELLGSLETLSNGLVGEFVIETERILLNRTRFNNSFMANLNSSIILDIPHTDITNTSITTITFSTLNNVMPARNASFNVSLFDANSNETVSDNTINAAVVLIRINATIQNVTLTYNKRNKSLSLNPQCVFWNFTIFDNRGAWDDKGCKFVSDVNDMVTCNCNHLTSFSILMATDIPPELKDVLDIITYVGVGISLASLVICLIIEGYVWKAITRNSTAFMRHVSIINTALSLLIADICFIIAASIAKNSLENPGEDYNVPVGPCSTATFFMHFFYLALFFWMLVSGLLLFYRTVMVFSHMSKSTMLAIGFSLGYGGPLIIAVITVAVTAPGNGYIRKDYACWLNWMETKALLAMVIPALTIVFINILIVIVVLFKMLRRGVGDAAQTDEKHTLWVILRCVVILTPLFGLTWSLGVGTMVSSTNKGLHIAFAFFNSLQGFFILVFGTLFDSKIRALLSKKIPGPTSSTGSNPTRSTSGGVSSFSGLNLISRLRGRRYIYRVSEATNSSSNGASESFMNI
ncbi:adhesion G protein-coupled receptor F5-like [Morone saxatilis]|uniref:adhesion G protein-coupled receptor F5-like n=1 Tax=Morone saxatilis TaxID=34816 RepID=UPI0015E22E4E|nr:adhesion G protein-coupled receptor F5-like [Morone saxatilis]